MPKKKEPELLWCQGCREYREQEDTGETEIIDRKKHRIMRCKACGRINKHRK